MLQQDVKAYFSLQLGAQIRSTVYNKTNTTKTAAKEEGLLKKDSRKQESKRVRKRIFKKLRETSRCCSARANRAPLTLFRTFLKEHIAQIKQSEAKQRNRYRTRRAGIAGE